MRKIKLVILLPILLYSNDIYTTNCLSCHKNQIQLKMFINRYTMKYSSEKRIKRAIYSYLVTPSIDKSVMPRGFLNRFGIKQKSKLSEKELKNAIDIYYTKYNIKQYIK